MKAGLMWLILLSLASERAFAQQAGGSAGGTNSVPFSLDTHLSALPREDPQLPQSDVIVRKKLQWSGPLVRPFKSTRVREFPKRVFHLVNPFVPTEARPQLERMRDVNPRAWSSIVGWHPGASAFAFADPITQESSMGLISISRAPQP